MIAFPAETIRACDEGMYVDALESQDTRCAVYVVTPPIVDGV